MNAAVYPASRPGPTPACDRRESSSSREGLRRARATVLEAVDRCSKGEAIVVTVEAPITRAEVRAALEEIDEHYHLVGIKLRFGLENDTLTAIFEPIDS